MNIIQKRKIINKIMTNANIDNAIYHTTYEDYGKGWLVNDEKSFSN